MFMVTTYVHSKWPEVENVCSTRVANTVEVVQKWFNADGLPVQTVCDNGQHFIPARFAKFMKRTVVKHIHSTPYHPSSNGVGENVFVKTVKEAPTTKGVEEHYNSDFKISYSHIRVE